MQIISWHRGETRTFDTLPEDDNGVSTAASYLQAQMRISTAGTCVMIEGVPTDLDDGTVQGAGFRFGLNDAALEAARGGDTVTGWARLAWKPALLLAGLAAGERGARTGV